MSDRVSPFVGRLLDGIIGRVASMPTTNVRIAVTLALVIATGAVYLALTIKVQLFGLAHSGTEGALVAGAWKPDSTWLTFLAAMSGLDAIQFGAKRLTDSSYVTAKNAGAPPTPTAS